MSMIWYPHGTIITANTDGSLTFNAPNGWFYVGLDKHNNPITPSMMATETKISCECLSPNGWCNPFFYKGTGGCLGKCEDCRMNTVISGLNIEVMMGGYINLSIPSQLIGDNFQSIPAGNKAIIQISEVQNLINTFLQSIFPTGPIPTLIFNQLRNEIEAPENCLIGLVNIAGRAIPLPIPKNIANNFSGVTASCDCNCELDTTWTPMGTFYQCKDTCPSKCTLTIKNVMQFGQLEIKNISQTFLF